MDAYKERKVTLNVGVIGYGWVGVAVETGFQSISNVRVYDKYKNTESLDSVVNNSSIIFVCVPTPMAQDGSCDLSIVKDVCKEIDSCAESKKYLIIKSTVIPGTTKLLSELYPRHRFCFNPEFLTECNFINDFLNQDRVVLGCADNFSDKDRFAVAVIYRKFLDNQKRSHESIHICDSHEAEMCKYVTNAFLATKLSFLNEIYDICIKSNIDYNKVIQLVKLDKRLGNSHWQVPGPDGKRGWGKSCFPKDLNALISMAYDLGIDPIVMDSVWTKNLLVREDHDWENLSQVNGRYKKR